MQAQSDGARPLPEATRAALYKCIDQARNGEGVEAAWRSLLSAGTSQWQEVLVSENRVNAMTASLQAEGMHLTQRARELAKAKEDVTEREIKAAAFSKELQAQQAQLEQGKAAVVIEARQLVDRSQSIKGLEATVLATETRLKEAQREHEAAMQRHEGDLLRRVQRLEAEEARLEERIVKNAAAEAACTVRECNLSHQGVGLKEKGAALELRALEVAQGQDKVKGEHERLAVERKEYHSHKKGLQERTVRVEEREKLVKEKEDTARELERKAVLREERADKAKSDAIESRSQLKLEESRMEVLRGEWSLKQKECEKAWESREEREARIDADLRTLRKERGELDLASLKLEQARSVESSALADREAALHKGEAALAARLQTAAEKEAAAAMIDVELQRIAQLQSQAGDRERSLSAKEAKTEEDAKVCRSRETRSDDKERRLRSLEQNLEERELEASSKLSRAERLEASSRDSSESLAGREEAVRRLEEEAEFRNRDLTRREAEQRRGGDQVGTRQREVEAREAGLDEWEGALSRKEGQMEQLEEALARREEAVAAATVALEADTRAIQDSHALLAEARRTAESEQEAAIREQVAARDAESSLNAKSRDLASRDETLRRGETEMEHKRADLEAAVKEHDRVDRERQAELDHAREAIGKLESGWRDLNAAKTSLEAQGVAMSTAATEATQLEAHLSGSLADHERDRGVLEMESAGLARKKGELERREIALEEALRGCEIRERELVLRQEELQATLATTHARVDDVAAVLHGAVPRPHGLAGEKANLVRVEGELAHAVSSAQAAMAALRAREEEAQERERELAEREKAAADGEALLETLSPLLGLVFPDKRKFRGLARGEGERAKRWVDRVLQAEAQSEALAVEQREADARARQLEVDAQAAADRMRELSEGLEELAAAEHAAAGKSETLRESYAHLEKELEAARSMLDEHSLEIRTISSGVLDLRGVGAEMERRLDQGAELVDDVYGREDAPLRRDSQAPREPAVAVLEETEPREVRVEWAEAREKAATERLLHAQAEATALRGTVAHFQGLGSDQEAAMQALEGQIQELQAAGETLRGDNTELRDALGEASRRLEESKLRRIGKEADAEAQLEAEARRRLDEAARNEARNQIERAKLESTGAQFASREAKSRSTEERIRLEERTLRDREARLSAEQGAHGEAIASLEAREIGLREREALLAGREREQTRGLDALEERNREVERREGGPEEEARLRRELHEAEERAMAAESAQREGEEAMRELQGRLYKAQKEGSRSRASTPLREGEATPGGAAAGLTAGTVAGLMEGLMHEFQRIRGEVLASPSQSLASSATRPNSGSLASLKRSLVAGDLPSPVAKTAQAAVEELSQLEASIARLYLTKEEASPQREPGATAGRALLEEPAPDLASMELRLRRAIAFFEAVCGLDNALEENRRAEIAAKLEALRLRLAELANPLAQGGWAIVDTSLQEWEAALEDLVGAVAAAQRDAILGNVVSPLRASAVQRPAARGESLQLSKTAAPSIQVEDLAAGSRHEEEENRRRVDAMFDSLDANRDGVITREELSKAGFAKHPNGASPGTTAKRTPASSAGRPGAFGLSPLAATPEGSVSRLAGNLEALLDVRSEVLGQIQQYTARLTEDKGLDGDAEGLVEVQSRLSESWTVLKQVDEEIKASTLS